MINFDSESNRSTPKITFETFGPIALTSCAVGSTSKTYPEGILRIYRHG
jgi:hypothetical protein